MKKVWAVGAAVAMVAAMGLAWGVSAAEDDLTVVKRAVATASADASDAPATAARPAASGGVRKEGRRPSWLKVRVVESKDGKKEDRVSVTVPLALLAVLGKDATVDLQELGVPGLKNAERNVRIAELLDSLEPGTMLVEVQDQNAHVRVWVE